MVYRLNQSVRASLLAQQIGLDLVGPDIEITHVSSIVDAEPGCLTFDRRVDVEVAPHVVTVREAAFEVTPASGSMLRSQRPRLDFMRALQFLNDSAGFATYDFESYVHPTVQVGRNVVIERGCRIQEGVVIEHNVVIQSGTSIGAFSRIRTGSCIGGDGFGFERGEAPVRFIHLGGVQIGRHVEIGALNSVVRGALGDTIVGDHVKTDNLVHIAHNCRIGSGVFITACAELSGGVEVGDDAWIGPNAAIMQKARIGKRALVGLGAVVVKDVEASAVYAGNPAKLFRKLD